MDEITVIEIATGDEVTILRSAYDANPTAYKLMKKDEKPESPDLEKFAQRMIEKSAEQTAAIVDAKLKELGAGKVDRGRLAQGAEGKERSEPEGGEHMAAYGELVRANPSWERKYHAIPEEDRDIRTPANDLMCQDYIRACASGDVETLRRIADIKLKTGGDIGKIDRQLSTTATEGGEFVPVPLSDTLVRKRDKRERIAPLSMRVRSDNTELRIPIENNVPAMTGVLENAAIATNLPSFAEVILNKQKTGNIVAMSWELTQDKSAAFDMVEIITNQGARKLAVYFDAQSAADGDGIAPHHTDALEEATITEVTNTTSNVLNRVAIVEVLLDLPTEYRDGTSPVWMGNAVTTARLANILDLNLRPLYGLNNDAARVVSDVGNAIMVVEGVPYIEVPFATDILMVGLLEEGFAVLMDNGVRVDSSRESGTAFTNDQVHARILDRRDSAVVLTDAFRKSEVMTS